MLNRSGITKTTYGNQPQILANVDLQASVGVIVDAAIGRVSEETGRKIVAAGTPVHVDFANLATPAGAESQGNPTNAVILHDVDVTAGNANGTALYFGVVNKARVVDSTVAGWLTPGTNIGNVMVVNIP